MSFITFSATTASGEGEKTASMQTAINGSNECQSSRLDLTYFRIVTYDYLRTLKTRSKNGRYHFFYHISAKCSAA